MGVQQKVFKYSQMWEGACLPEPSYSSLRTAVLFRSFRSRLTLFVPCTSLMSSSQRSPRVDIPPPPDLLLYHGWRISGVREYHSARIGVQRVSPGLMAGNEKRDPCRVRPGFSSLFHLLYSLLPVDAVLETPYLLGSRADTSSRQTQLLNLAQGAWSVMVYIGKLVPRYQITWGAHAMENLCFPLQRTHP